MRDFLLDFRLEKIKKKVIKGFYCDKRWNLNMEYGLNNNIVSVKMFVFDNCIMVCKKKILFLGNIYWFKE